MDFQWILIGLLYNTNSVRNFTRIFYFGTTEKDPPEGLVHSFDHHHADRHLCDAAPPPFFVDGGGIN